VNLQERLTQSVPKTAPCRRSSTIWPHFHPGRLLRNPEKHRKPRLKPQERTGSEADSRAGQAISALPQTFSGSLSKVELGNDNALPIEAVSSVSIRLTKLMGSRIAYASAEKGVRRSYDLMGSKEQSARMARCWLAIQNGKPAQGFTR
jgi:hypothetical protein